MFFLFVIFAYMQAEISSKLDIVNKTFDIVNITYVCVFSFSEIYSASTHLCDLCLYCIYFVLYKLHVMISKTQYKYQLKTNKQFKLYSKYCTILFVLENCF